MRSAANGPSESVVPTVPVSLRGAMLVQFAAGGAVIPFITLLLRDRGLSLDQISIVLSCGSATLLVFPFLWGMLADCYVPLNRLFTIMNLLGCGALLWFVWSRSFAAMLAAYTLFFACFNPTLSLINALCFHHLADPGQQFSRLRAWGSWGWIVPFLPISLYLALSSPDLDFTVYIGAGCCAGMAVLSLWLPYTIPGSLRGEQSPTLSYGPAVRRLLKNGNYLVLLVSMLLVSGSYTLVAYYSPPLLEDVGIARAWLGPIQGIGVLFEIVLLRWQPDLVRRWSYSTTILLGAGTLVVRQVLFAAVTDPWVLASSYLLTAVVIVFFHTGVSVLVNAMAGAEVRSTAQTLLILAGQGLGPVLSNLAAGRLAVRYPGTLQPIFWFAAVLALGATLLVAWRARKLNRAES